MSDSSHAMHTFKLFPVVMTALLCGCATQTRKSDATPAAIRADFERVQIGMTRNRVQSLLGSPLHSLQQTRPLTFPGRYDDPKDTKLTYILQESYYPAPHLKRVIDSPYMMEGFIIYYAESDTVVHKSLHPDLR